MKAYLEDFKLIKVISEKHYDLNNHYQVELLNHKYDLSLDHYEIFDNLCHLYLTSKIALEPHFDLKVIIDEEQIKVELGKIARSKYFDEYYYFDDWLGFLYQEEQTTFRLWSPVAKAINIVVDQQKYPLSYKDKGVWEVTIKSNLDQKPYFYEVRINEDFFTTLDPYAKSSSSNHQVNYVIDFNKTYQFKNNYYTKKNWDSSKAVIYELNIRDATSLVNCQKNGTYEALTKSVNKKYGLGNIKHLPITHLQLMPCMAFSGVDEEIKDANDANFSYNWGYNPMQYMVPSGYFSVNPNDPYQRINELKTLIDTIHLLNMGVNFDVVFNHVYDSTWFPLERLVPGYTFRTDERGFLTNCSWCGNDLCTEHLMVRKLIIDTLLFYQQNYLVDGFRFDLMGLIDLKTMQIITKTLLKNNPLTLIYGEGWCMDDYKKACLTNAKEIPQIAFFNDYFRNHLRGDVNNPYSGYLFGEDLNNETFFKLIKGIYQEEGFFRSFRQSINYVECHDNYTLYDLIKIKRPNYNNDQIIKIIKLSLGMVCFSFGIVFIHAGEELLRSKKGYDNSYNLPDDINGIVWDHENVTDILKTFLTLRQKLYDDFFKISLDKYYDLPVIRVIKNDFSTYQLIFMNKEEDINLYFAPGTTLIFDGDKEVNVNIQHLKINQPGLYIIKKF